IIALFSFFGSFAQGTIRGKITDNTGEALIGATVVIKSKPTSGVMADLDGNYSVKISDTTAQTIVVSYVSYKTQEIIVHPVKGEVIIKDFVLVSSTALDEVVVVSKVNKKNNYYMENIKMKSSTTMDYISQETMKKTGDVNVVNAVARVSGVSASSSAGFITVRGIGDRYIVTTLNGSRIPTLDPYSNNIRLDLFPASLVDNIVITKTASPDLPGNWAGAYISIETKDYPDKLTVDVQSSIGYNAQTTFKDVVSTEHSSTDWLGFDNGFRNHPQDKNGNPPSANLTPTDYQTLVALGLGPYYNSIGVNGSPSQWNQQNGSAATYFDLGLVQLGLLQNSQLGDQAAIAKATAAFNNGPYRNEAFNSLNASSAKLGQSFKDNWNTTTRQALPNFMQSFSIGNQVNLFGKPLGFLLGFRYNSGTQYDPNSTANRPRSNGSLESAFNQQATQETNAWNALANISYKYSNNHSITLMFMPNFTGVNNARNSVDVRDPAQNVVTKSQFYDQRKQLVYQLKSEHYIPKPQLKIELNASYTGGKSSTPDFKNITYWKSADNTTYQIDPAIGDGMHRYYRYYTDNLFDSRLSAELPILKSDVGPRKLKFGGSYQYNYKTSDLYDYYIAKIGTGVAPLTSDDINQYFSLNNFAISNNTINMYYQEDNSPVNHTFGKSSIVAGYVMTDFTIIKPLRFSGGVRVEQSSIFTDASKFDSLHYAANDPRRVFSNAYPLLNPGKLNNLNLLPSVNLIYKLNKNEDAPVNLRANFSETVARPSIRELSDVPTFDYNLRSSIYGNSDLKQVSIKNYDLRLESYFKNKDYISGSVFYKDFKNHIELINENGAYTWQNVNKSYVLGFEIEGKKSITKKLDLMVNATYVKSSTTYEQEYQITPNGYKHLIP
ncbi:MAG: TonB-dependent receptor, partial [Bacteroidia bacterium]